MRPGAEPMGAHLFGPPVTLPAAAVASAKLVASRADALALLPRGGSVAGLGTQAGRYAGRILEVSRPDELHLFEFDTPRARAPAVSEDPRVRLHRGDSSRKLAEFPDGTFAWTDLDGDHSEAGVRRDPDCTAPEIRPDGLPVFDDDTLWSPMELADHGTVPVVNDIPSRGGREVVDLAPHPLIYCGLALRRAA